MSQRGTEGCGGKERERGGALKEDSAKPKREEASSLFSFFLLVVAWVCRCVGVPNACV